MRFEVELRLAEAEIEVSTAAATYGAGFSATVPIFAMFAALFASPNGDSYDVSLYMRFDGRAVSGRFKTRDSSYRQAGVFGAR